MFPQLGGKLASTISGQSNAAGASLTEQPAASNALPNPVERWKPNRTLDTIGKIGDIMAAVGGRSPLYAPFTKVKQAEKDDLQFVNALGQWTQNPDDMVKFGQMLITPERAKDAFAMQTSFAKQRDNDLDRIGKADEYIMRVLGAAHDQPSYDRAKSIAARLYGRFGLDLSDLGLPDTYSDDLPDVFRMQGATPSQQLMADNRNRRLDWDMEDDTIDNARADRGLDDLINHRGEQRASLDRYRQQRIATTQRGQDMADRRQRARPVKAGSAPSSARSSASKAPTAIDANGNQVMWDGKAWVPAR